jgi:hypothetical protein
VSGKKNKIAIIVLGTLLVITNLCWLYLMIDEAVTNKHTDIVLQNLLETQKQLVAILPEIAGNMRKENVIKIVQRYSDGRFVEDDSIIWIGMVGLEFNVQDKLTKVVPFFEE